MNIILLYIMKMAILSSFSLNKADTKVNESYIVIRELSDEYKDKKEQIEDAYGEIINQYIDAVKNNYYFDIRKTNEDLFREKFGPDFNQKLLMDLWARRGNKYDFQVFYGFKDVDHNGIPELFIGSSNGIHSMNFYDIYTFDGTKVINPFDEIFENSDFGYRNYLYLYTDGILAQNWVNSGFNSGWSFYRFKDNGVNIELIDVISQDYNYEGELCFFHHMDWLSERFKHDYEGKIRISYKEYSQIYDKYIGGGEDKIFWNKICDMEEVNMEEEAQLKEALERCINSIMDRYIKKSYEELGQINIKKLKAYYEKKGKLKKAYGELIDAYLEAIENNFYQELKERDMKSYEIRLESYLSRQIIEDSALYKEKCYDYRIYCTVKDIDENGIPELLIGASNGINGIYFCDMVTFNGEKIIKLFDESDYVYGRKKELFLSTDGIFIIRSDDGEKGLKTEFYKLSSDGWHVEFIESISYKVDDSGQKDYYRNKNGEYKISWELYSLISEEYPIRSVVGSCMIEKISNK